MDKSYQMPVEEQDARQKAQGSGVGGSDMRKKLNACNKRKHISALQDT